ncbi:MAG TPA: hypothetical protein VFK44_01755 [Bacillales bacterium]|nr:hypothetical protein [Bacillales bacterium]
MRTNYWRFITIGMILLLGTSLFFIHPVSAQTNVTNIYLPTKGTINGVFTTYHRKNPTSVTKKVIHGINVHGNVRIRSNAFQGSIVIPSQDKSYKLNGTKVNNENTPYPYYKGSVLNHNGWKFEAYLLHRGYHGNVVINLFKTNGKGERIEAFTVHMDNSRSKIWTQQNIHTPLNKKLTRDSNDEKISYTTLKNKNYFMTTSSSRTDYDLLLGLYDDGIDIEVEGWENRDVESPWKMRTWTDVSDMWDEIGQSKSVVTRVNILKSIQDANGADYSYFDLSLPNQDGQESFTIYWYSDSLGLLAIPVNTSWTDLLHDGSNTEHMQVTYKWNYQNAYDYEYGNNNEGILTDSEYNWRNGYTPHNSYGYIEIPVDFDLTYEFVGNYREYAYAGTSDTVWYNDQ